MSSINKYWQLARTTWENSLVYRVNFFMWRGRQVLSLITGYFLWLAVFADQNLIFGYSQVQMMTYILAASLVQAAVLSSRTIDLASVINSGDLSQILLKPVGMFKYWLAQDVADKLLNILFSIGELSLLWFLLKPQIAIGSGGNILTFGLFLILAIILYFWVNFLFGTLGFWTPEVWAPRFLLMILLQFVAGNMFPLDILPKGIVSVINLTPFPYLVYFPTQALLGRLSISQIYQGISASLFWVGVMYLVANNVWKKGLREYGAEGN